MEKWITAPEIIEKGYLNEITLVCAVKAGDIMAYDKQTLLDIDVIGMDSFFAEIKVSVQTPTPWMYREKAICYTDDKKAPRKPWHTLYEELLFLTEKVLSGSFCTNPIRIPESQFREILTWWGTEQVREIVFESVFNEEEIKKVASVQLSGNEVVLSFESGICWDIPSQVELARRCNVDPRTIRNWIKSGLLNEDGKRFSSSVTGKWLEQTKKRNALESFNNSK